MTDDQWQTAWRLFQSADVSPENSREFLDRASGDPVVRDALLALLKQHQNTQGPPGRNGELDRIGQRVGRYVLTDRLGEGGMGEVYAARDSELGRFVAIKIFSPAASATSAAVDRFILEAKAASALNHPNIVTIHEVIHASSRLAIVMELVDGASLRQLCGTPLPVDRILNLAEQMARALAAAHARGIVHCDIKPENLMVRPDGFVKVLDFGLARDLSATSQTLLHAGTLRYMSPEQSRAEAPSRASDVFSLGIVLYELAAGTYPFEKGSIFETLNALNHSEPPALSSLNPFVPPALEALILRMLAKAAADRPPMSEVARSLESRFAGPSAPPALGGVSDARPIARSMPPGSVPPGSMPPGSTPPGSSSRDGWPWLPALLGAAGLIAAAVWLWSAVQPPRTLIRFNVDLADNNSLTRVALSPDGTRLAYSHPENTGSSPPVAMLFTRLLDQSQPVLLPGTEGARDPFFSPDGQWIGFFAASNLKKISVRGGTPLTLCPTNGTDRGASWGSDGFIIANLDNSHLVRVPDNGGKPQMLQARPEDHQERTWRWPQILPGGRQVLFTGSRGSGAGGRFEGARIEALDLVSGEVTVVQRGGYFGRYLPTGHLIYVHDGTLFAVRLDLGKLKTQGTPVPLLDDAAGDPSMGIGLFDFSTERNKPGILVYHSGKYDEGPRTLAWLAPNGTTENVLTGVGLISPAISPDGRTLALSVGGNIVIHDLESGAERTLTHNALINTSPVWAPDGKHIAFEQDGGDESVIWWTRADGSTEPRRLFATVEGLRLGSISPDSRYLAFARQDAVNGWDLWTLRLDPADPDRPNPGTAEPLVNDPYGQFSPVISPDGRSIAYVRSLANDQNNVYVREFPAGSAASERQVSMEEGNSPRWSPDGKELFFLSSDYRIVRVPYLPAVSNSAALKAKPWSPARVISAGFYSNFDVAPSGKRLLVFPAPGGVVAPRASYRWTVLLNFFDELKRKAP